MNLDCQRWAKLADLDAVGEALPSDERAFQRAHEAGCPHCSREARVWRSMGAMDGQDAELDEREVERVLSVAALDEARRVAFSRRWKNALVVGVGITACAAAAFLWFQGKPDPALRSDGEQALGTRAGATSPSPSPAVAPTASQPVVQASPAACSQVVPGATLCLANGTVLGRRSLDGPHREIEVARGRAVVLLQPQPLGSSFSLTTASGKVTAVGTIFSVDVSEDGTTVARVVEGKVLVRAGQEDTPHAVKAGQAFRLGEQQPTPLSNQERDLDLGLLSMAPGDEKNERGAASPSDAGQAPARSVQPPARDSLELARSLRASGDFRQAADVYRKIYADNPRSPSGRAALVSLGDLLLTLHDPRGALRSFDSYLLAGGDLSQEAMFGRVRALRALNQRGEEERAIKRFIAAYPDAPQSRILRARLAAMPK